MRGNAHFLNAFFLMTTIFFNAIPKIFSSTITSTLMQLTYVHLIVIILKVNDFPLPRFIFRHYSYIKGLVNSLRLHLTYHVTKSKTERTTHT